MVNKKILVNGINQDDAYILVDTKEYLNALNIRFATSENGKVGQLSNIEGNTIKNATIGGSFSLPAGTNTTIGSYEDFQNRRAFFFNYNSNGNHGLYTYDADTDLVYTVLLSSQVVGGLNFSLNNLIHSVAYVNGLLYWTDNKNWQRRINVDAGIKLNHPTYTTDVIAYVLDKNSSGASGTTHLSSSVINLIRNQPRFPLTVSKVQDNTYVNNLVKDGSFQFAYRFVYRDGETSTLSPLSKLVNFNLASDTTRNAIDVTIPLSQKIEQDVKYIEIAVKFMIDGNMSVIKTFDSGFSTHNSGTAITFKFYNDVAGSFIDAATSVKQFDSVPIYSKTLEAAKNRLFLGNNTDGYTAPSTTSLISAPVIKNASNPSAMWSRIEFRDGSWNIAYAYFIYIYDAGTNTGYYTPATQPTNLSTTVTFASLTNQANIQAVIQNLAAYLNSTRGGIWTAQGFMSNIATANVTGIPPAASSVNGTTIFKSDSSYSVGVIFFDEAGRKCGVVTNDSLKLVTPDRDYALTTYTAGISWSLSNNNNPLDQIPIWATHYAIVRTKCLRTSFFFQIRTNDIKYAVRNPTTKEISFDPNYQTSHYGLALKVSGLFNNGLGYTFQDGDILKIYTDINDKYSLKVKETYGEYIIVDLINLGGVSNLRALVEVYTPYYQSDNEPYYEIGEIYAINDAGKNTRKFSVTSGELSGDIYILNQNDIPSGTYPCETMSTNNKYWKYWFNDIGRPSIVVRTGQTVKPVSIYYSNVIVPGTQTNGLSSFEALSQTNVPLELGQINRLILTSKVQSEGTVMLSVGEQETASLYIGEAQIFDNSGNSFLATTSGVIGNINVLKGSLGTINPESVYRWKGSVVYFDANKGCWVRYDVNGLFPISNNKMAKYFRKIGQDILSYVKNSTEYNYVNPTYPARIVGGTDPYHEEYLCSVPRMYMSPQNTILADMDLSSNSYNFSTLSPSIQITQGTISLNYVFGAGPSASGQFTFSANNLNRNGTLDVTTAAGIGYEVSKDNITFYDSLTYNYTGISLSGTVYVRRKSGMNTGGISGYDITVSSSGASETVSVSSTVSNSASALITSSIPALGQFSYVSGSGPSASRSFLILASTLSTASGNITITPTTNYEVSIDNGTTWSTSAVTVSYTGFGSSLNSVVLVRLMSGRSVGSYNGENVVISGGGAPALNVPCYGYVYTGTQSMYSYSFCGYGNSKESALYMSENAPVTLYSRTQPISLSVGSSVFLDSAGSSALTGSSVVFMNGDFWRMDTYNNLGTIVAFIP